MKSIIAAINFWFLLQFLKLGSCDDVKTVAIIGGGIGGTSCADFLKKKLQNKIQIDLYEDKFLGGRLSSIFVDNILYEIGAPILAHSDKYTRHLVEKSPLSEIPIPITYPAYSIFKDEKLIEMGFKEALGQCLPIFKSSMRTWFVDDFLNKIYEVQAKGDSFRTVNQMLRKFELRGARFAESFLEFLRLNENGRFAIKLESLARIDYGKTLEVPFYPGYISFLKFERKNKKYSLQYGNSQLAEQHFRNSGAIKLNNKVIEVMKMSDNKLQVISIKNEDGKREFKFYDYVVIAHPLAENLPNIKITNFDDFKPVKGNFLYRVITILKGNLKKKFFNLKPKNSEPTGIVFHRNDIVDYVFKLKPFNRGKNLPVWKMQSSRKLSERDLGQYFENVKIIESKEWMAYPDYTTYDPIDAGAFVLGRNLLYINCIEWALSSIEMSTIGAFNVALLIYESVRCRSRPITIPDEFEYI